LELLLLVNRVYLLWDIPLPTPLETGVGIERRRLTKRICGDLT